MIADPQVIVGLQTSFPRLTYEAAVARTAGTSTHPLRETAIRRYALLLTRQRHQR